MILLSDTFKGYMEATTTMDYTHRHIYFNDLIDNLVDTVFISEAYRVVSISISIMWKDLLLKSDEFIYKLLLMVK